MRVSDLIARIKVEQAQITTVLQAGTSVNFESYQRLVGHYQGLDEALNIINQLLNEDDQDVE
jgi:hypothetical protein